MLIKQKSPSSLPRNLGLGTFGKLPIVLSTKINPLYFFYSVARSCHLFSEFQYGFRSSRSTADFLTVVSDRIARAFSRPGITRAVALDISEVFDRV